MPIEAVHHPEPTYTNAEKARIRDIVQNPSTPATVLVVLMLDCYGPEVLEWAPETIQLELRDDFGAKIPDVSLSRLLAGERLVTTDEFYHDLPAFNDLCIILAGGHHQPGTWIPADAAEIAISITEAVLLSPPETDQNPFSPDIQAFIGQVLKNEGILQPPDILKFAEHDPGLADRVRYDFSDDPELFSAIFEADKEKTDEINRSVQSWLRRVLFELETLPLKNGKADNLARQLLQQLPKTSEEPIG